MAFAVITLACCLFYASSKYFPWQGMPLLQANRTKVLGLGILTAFLALFLFNRQYDGTTAFMIWSMALMTILSSVVVSLKMNRKWIWGWGALSLFFLVIDIL